MRRPGISALLGAQYRCLGWIPGAGVGQPIAGGGKSGSVAHVFFDAGIWQKPHDRHEDVVGRNRLFRPDEEVDRPPRQELRLGHLNRE